MVEYLWCQRGYCWKYVSDDAAHRPSWGQRSSCGEGPQLSLDDEPGWAGNVELPVYTTGSPALSQCPLPTTTWQFNNSTLMLTCLFVSVVFCSVLHLQSQWHGLGIQQPLILDHPVVLLVRLTLLLQLHLQNIQWLLVSFNHSPPEWQRQQGRWDH